MINDTFYAHKSSTCLSFSNTFVQEIKIKAQKASPIYHHCEKSSRTKQK